MPNGDVRDRKPALNVDRPRVYSSVHLHLRLVRTFVLFICALIMLPAFAQLASAPDEPIVPPGVPPDERVDLTGDGLPDLVITGRTDHIKDREQHVDGWYRRMVRPLAGTSILLRTTPNSAGYFTLREGEKLDTAALAKGFHFKQLMWSASDANIEFKLLEQPFGEGLPPEVKGWYGMGEDHEGSMVLRSTMGGRTSIAAFNIRFNLPAGRIWISTAEMQKVPADFGAEGDPPPPAQKVEEPNFFGHEVEPQVIIPPGLPPDVQLDIAGDEAPDIVLTGHEEHWHGVGRMGYYVRGISPLPGMAFLMKREAASGPLEIFRLPSGQRLTPDSLAMGVQNGTLYWASPERERVFCAVLRHPFGMDELPQEWSPANEADGDLVYRTTYYGRETIIGVLEVRAQVPGGELGVQPQNWVKEGEVLEVR